MPYIRKSDVLQLQSVYFLPDFMNTVFYKMTTVV